MENPGSAVTETIMDKSVDDSATEGITDESPISSRELRVFIVITTVLIGGLITVASILFFLGNGPEGATPTRVSARGGDAEATQSDSSNTGLVVPNSISDTRNATAKAIPTMWEQTIPTTSSSSMLHTTSTTSAGSPPSKSTIQEKPVPTTSASTAPDTTPTPAAGGTPRAKPVPPNFMACTVNGLGPSLRKIQLPANVCDAIFFVDSSDEEVRGKDKAKLKKNKLAFSDWRKSYPSIGLGFSTSLRKVDLNKDKIAKLESDIRYLRREGFLYTAVLNLYGDDVTEEGFTLALQYLKIAYNAVLGNTPEMYFVLGAAIDDPTKHGVVRLMKDIFIPSLFISVAHISYDDRARNDCRILPPTWLSIPPNVQPVEVTYGRTLNQSCDVLLEVARAGVQVPVAISFSMSGRLYKPNFSNPDSPNTEEYDLFRPCEDFEGDHYISPSELCSSPEMTLVLPSRKKPDVVSTFETGTQRTLTFDDEDTLRYKVCETRHACQGVPFGLTTYDFEYDEKTIKCDSPGSVSFARVRHLRSLMRYLESANAANAFNKSKCLAL